MSVLAVDALGRDSVDMAGAGCRAMVEGTVFLLADTIPNESITVARFGSCRRIALGVGVGVLVVVAFAAVAAAVAALVSPTRVFPST